MKTILEYIRKTNAWLYKSEKHLTTVLRHTFIWIFIVAYINTVYISKIQKPTLEYNVGILIFVVIFVFLAKYVAKILFKMKYITDKIDSNKKDPQ